MKKPSNERLLVIDTLTNFLNGKKDDILNSETNVRINQVYNNVYGVLRKNYLLNEYIKNKVKKKPPLKIFLIIQLAMYELLYNRSSKDYAVISEALHLADYYELSNYKGLINAILRNIDNDFLKKLPTYPAWILEEINKVFKERSNDVIHCFQNISPLFLSINNLKISDEDFLERMKKQDIAVNKIKSSIFCCNSRKIIETLEFKEGYFLIQDLAAQYSVELLDPFKGMRMLDLCSAPGSKSIKAAVMVENDAEIIALDKSSSRLIKFYENINKVKTFCIKIVNINPLKENFEFNKFDRVIVDPPCSALGVMGRHPDVLINRKKEDLEQLANIQVELLSKGINSLKSGGKLVYSVCTFTEAETTGVINRVLKNFEGVYLINSNIKEFAFGDFTITVPNSVGMDGHFIAVLGKK